MRGDVDAPTYESSNDKTGSRKYKDDGGFTQHCEAPGCRKTIGDKRWNEDNHSWVTELDNDEVHHEFCSDEHALKHMDAHPEVWDHTGDDYDKPSENTIHDVYRRMVGRKTGVLHDEPEPALPSTDGAARGRETPTRPGGHHAAAERQRGGPDVETMRDAPWGFPESTIHNLLHRMWTATRT